MSEEILSSRRIFILREEVSRKIAAGEVIDRPFSVVRELLDNAIDANSKNIEVYIENGGISRIRVVDDGEGMTEDDLKICFHRHATSKIREEEDLYKVSSLGFRGEALASVAACSRLEINSMASKFPAGGQGRHAHCLTVEGGRLINLLDCQGKQGTVVDVSDLFFNMPVRKKFLKNPQSETGRCRQALVEKALPHPVISFRFFINKNLKNFFPAQTIDRRISSCFGIESSHLSLVKGGEDGYRLIAVVGHPELCRRDRKMIQVFVNRRRIFEYSLIQAVEYAFSPYMPGGNFPVVFIFLEVEPDLVDFNIHPAKREARFRNLQQLHRGLVSVLKSYLKQYDIKAKINLKPSDDSIPRVPGQLPLYQFHEPEPEGKAGAAINKVRPRYCGQLFRLFLLVEYGESLFVVDQHAAHERILFNRLIEKPVISQELLLPIHFEVTEQEDELLKSRLKFLEQMGITIEHAERNAYEITAMPEDFLCLEEDKLIEVLVSGRSIDELKNEIFSLIACRLAIKEGDEVDSLTAENLIRDAFALDNARCPHGRPIWFEIGKDELFKKVGRT